MSSCASVLNAFTPKNEQFGWIIDALRNPPVHHQGLAEIPVSEFVPAPGNGLNQSSTFGLSVIGRR